MRTFGILAMMIAIWVTVLAEASLADTTVTLEQAVGFTNAEGGEVVLSRGQYTIRPVEEWLELIPQGGKRRDAVLINAESLMHSEDVDRPNVRVKEIDDRKRELIVLLPGGKALKASGLVGKIQSRGLSAKAPFRGQSKIPSRLVSEENKKGALPPKFIPEDPWDKVLHSMIQTLMSRVKKLEHEVKTLKQNQVTHHHDYVLPRYGEGGLAWVSISQLRKMEKNKTHSLDKYGMYFRGKANSSTEPWLKQTSEPKN